MWHVHKHSVNINLMKIINLNFLKNQRTKLNQKVIRGSK